MCLNCKIDAKALKMVDLRLPVCHLQRVYCPGCIKPSVQSRARRFEDELARAPCRSKSMSLCDICRVQSPFAVNNFRAMTSVTFLQLRFYACHHIHLSSDVRQCGGRMKKNDFNAWSELSVLYLPSLWSIMERIKDARHPFLKPYNVNTPLTDRHFTQSIPYTTRNHIQWLVWANVGLWIQHGISPLVGLLGFIS
jgi:hypothetical protein